MDSLNTPVVVGFTTDETPCVVLAMGAERSVMSLAETSRLTNNLRSLVRKLRRASWKEVSDV